MPRRYIEIEPEPDHTWLLVFAVVLLALLYPLIRFVAALILIAVFIGGVWWLIKRFLREDEKR